MKTGIIWDERYLAHDTGPYHPESPLRLKAIHQVIGRDPNYHTIIPRQATRTELEGIHTPSHVDQVLSFQGKAHQYDGDTIASKQSTEAALLACGGLIESVKQVEEGLIKNAFAFIRPPGHHAEADHAMGFCLFNNVAVAAQYLIKQKNKSRILIMDFDVHHGNGTQNTFYERSDVFYISTHQYPFYPGTGDETQKGRGQGEGYNLNIPLTALSDDADYQQAFEDQVIPAIESYKPDFILVSAGYDAHKLDPLGGMNVSLNGFAYMSEALTNQAKKHCGGKVVYVLEGGYDLKGLQEGVEATLKSL